MSFLQRCDACTSHRSRRIMSERFFLWHYFARCATRIINCVYFFAGKRKERKFFCDACICMSIVGIPFNSIIEQKCTFQMDGYKSIDVQVGWFEGVRWRFSFGLDGRFSDLLSRTNTFFSLCNFSKTRSLRLKFDNLCMLCQLSWISSKLNFWANKRQFTWDYFRLFETWALFNQALQKYKEKKINIQFWKKKFGTLVKKVGIIYVFTKLKICFFE